MRLLTIIGGLTFIMASQLHADPILVATANQFFGRYDTVTGSFTLLGTSSSTLNGLGFHGSALYGNDTSGSPSLYDVNAGSGFLSLVGPLGNGTTGVLASSPDGSTLLLAGSNNLYSVNTTTGTASLIGALGFTNAGGYGVSYGPDGNLYDTSGGSLYRLNPLTGAGTFIGSGTPLNSIVSADGNLYGFGGSNMYSVNLATGATTLIRSTLTLERGNFFAETAFVQTSASPEPGSASLLVAVSVLGLFAFRLRRIQG